MKVVYIALGSNLGDRAGHLHAARTALQCQELKILRESSLYETAPQGYLDQPWFLNQVVEAATSLLPRRLLQRLLKIERDMGRKRTIRDGPRIIDLDIVFYGSAVIESEDLEVPHPRMAERRFVLDPMAELNPEFRHPRTGSTMRELLDRVKDQPVRFKPD